MAHWVDEFTNAEELKTARVAARTAKDAAASRRIRSDAPEYLRQLEIELRESASRLSEKPSLRVSVSVTNDSDPEVEVRLHVHVLLHGQWPEITYTDIFWLVSQNVLRCHTAEGTAYKLYFAAPRGEGPVGVYAENGNGVVMAPEQAARYIVEPVIKRLCGSAD